ASLRDDLDALDHAQRCVKKVCKRGSETRRSGKHRVLRHNNPRAWHDADLAREIILLDPLSLQVRGGWHRPGEYSSSEEYEILVSWGGPASRIIGDLDERLSPATARFQYQEWFTPWIDARISDADEHTLLAYVRQFDFGC